MHNKTIAVSLFIYVQDRNFHLEYLHRQISLVLVLNSISLFTKVMSQRNFKHEDI